MKKVGIIGGGLAGLLLTEQLLCRKEKLEIHLFSGPENHCSKVAAGMINPLVFRRMTKSWRVDDFLPFLKSYYPELEKKVGASFFNPVAVRRYFSSQQERNYWEKKHLREEHQNYMSPIREEDENINPYANSFGSGRVKECYLVHASDFLVALKNHLEQHISLRNEDFKYDHLSVQSSSYGKEKFDAFIFCEGYTGKENPWFGDLPLTQTLGEILTVQLADFPQDESSNRKCFVLPQGENVFKTGSTYTWDTPDPTPTEKGKHEILQNLSVLTAETPKIVNHVAGVRPTVKDRRPLVGQHHKHQNLFIFNGLGAKGFMTAPLLIHEFCNFLLENEPLPYAVNIDRFYRKRNINS